MPVDHGNPGKSSRYYGTGESEERQREHRRMTELRSAFAEGRRQGYEEGAASPAAYNRGLAHMARELGDASSLRCRAVRKVRSGEGR